MKELTKTLLFVAAAVLTMSVAVYTRPKVEQGSTQASEEVGTLLFPDLTDASAVTGLEMLSFNEELGSLKPFRIEQAREGEWIIPSRDGYPADAQNRVARAATMFVDLKVLNVEQSADHEQYGVVEPELGVTSAGDQGVGTLLKVFGGSGSKSNNVLADLIIGKPHKDLPGQYYVRRPGKSTVYRVEIDPTELSTEFTDWIDPSLLPIPPTEITRLLVRSYSVLIQNTKDGSALKLTPGYDATLEPDDSTWKLLSLREPRQGTLVDSELEVGAELNQARLGEVVNAIPNIQIANVQRIPEALAAKLKAGNVDITTLESSSSLASRGFYPIKPDEQSGQLFAAQGELLVNLSAGIQFRLLFGGIGQTDMTGADTLNRYLLVMPSVYQAAFPEPELESLPGDDAELSENDRRIAIDRITKANEKKQADYQKRLEGVQKIVDQLRQKYGQWYYLIEEDMARKLRLPRNEFSQLSKKALEEGFGIEAFRMLQEAGLGSLD